MRTRPFSLGRGGKDLDAPREEEEIVDGDGGGTIGAIGIVLRRAIAQAREDRLTTSAQAVAYSLFLSIPSVLLVAVGAFSLVADGEDVARLIERAETIMPAEAAALLGDSLERSTQSTGTGLVMTMLGGVLALWSTTSAASTLMDAIAASSDRRDRRSFAHRRAIALVVVGCLVLAAALVVGLLVLG
ncbi:MAG: YihY/virulence factor BrkB family protein, partial [Gaiellaceae bacterium]